VCSSDLLLVNGDFEAGDLVRGVPRPWEAVPPTPEFKDTPQGTVETIRGGLPPGGRALRLTKLDGRLPWSPIVNNGYKLEAGGTYEFSVMAKGTLPTFVLRASARLKEQPPAKMAKAFPVPADFASVAFRFTVPQATESVNMGIAAPAGSAGEVLIDQAVLRRVLNAGETAMSNAPDYSPDPDPIHGLDALCERAGHKPWDLYWSKDHLLSYRVMFRDRKYGTWMWLLDDSPSIQYCETSSIWPGWNSDGSVMWVTGSRRTAKGGTARSWLFNADFSRLVPMPARGVPLWDLADPDVYYIHQPGKLTKMNHRTGEQKVLAT
jgi:hypothetical protein